VTYSSEVHALTAAVLIDDRDPRHETLDRRCHLLLVEAEPH
jgi:hypothetical protein